VSLLALPRPRRARWKQAKNLGAGLARPRCDRSPGEPPGEDGPLCADSVALMAGHASVGRRPCQLVVMLQAGSGNARTGDLGSGLACGLWPRLSRVMAGHPHLLGANRMPPLVPVTQLHAAGRDADDPEPAPTSRHLHPGTHLNPARRLGPLGRRGRSYPTNARVRGWAPRRVGLGADHCSRRLRPPLCARRLPSLRSYNPGILLRKSDHLTHRFKGSCLERVAGYG